MDSEFERLRELFLTIELDLGLEFAQTAKMQAQMQNHENFERSREYAEAALEVVHKFSARIVNSDMRQQLQERADELQKAVSSLWPRPN